MDIREVPPAPAEAAGRQTAEIGGYDAPRIEVVLTPEELSREVLYAGADTKD